MWLLSVHLVLAITIGALDSQSSPLPGPSPSQPSYEAVINISPTVWQPQSQAKQDSSIFKPEPTPFVFVSPPIQQESSIDSIFLSTTAVLPPPQPGIPSTKYQPSQTTSTEHMLSPIPPSVPPVPPITPDHEPSTLPCLHEHLYSCQARSPLGCRCDEQCKLFGDCCSDSVYVHNANIPNFDCVPNIVLHERIDEQGGVQYYWMISSCLKEKPSNEVINELADLCEAPSLSSPPISDNRTGLVYRNKYCAQCHGVPEKEQISWPSEWHCDYNLMNTAPSNDSIIDLDDFLAACYATVFTPPELTNETDRPFRARLCDRLITYKCQPPPGTNTSSLEYSTLEGQCLNEPGKARRISSAPGIYKNEYCALCSSPNMDRKNLECPPHLVSIDEPTIPSLTLTLLLDVTGSGIVVLGITEIQVTSATKQSCTEGQVFDVYSERCRESLSPIAYSNNGTSTMLGDSMNCTLIALNKTEYETINNQIIFWTALEQNVSVQGYNSEGKPLVCTNFTSNFNITINITRILYVYPAVFTILSYLGHSVHIVSAAILLFTYAAFAEMRTFYGKLFMNFVLVLLLGDLTFLLGSAVYAVSLEDVVCQVMAILLHYLFLARFVWMSLLSLNVARRFYHAMKMVVNEERESWHYLILYMAAGWLSPLLVLTVTVSVNYAIPGVVGYGVDGLCWMSQTLTITVSFIIPSTICILFTTGAFVFVCIILVKWHSSNVELDIKHKTGTRIVSVSVAVLCITCSTWMFGFIALIDSALSWAWYFFIILNTTQAVLLMLAYVCTAKVLRLYRTALKKVFPSCFRKCHCCYKSHISEQRTQLELNKQSMHDKQR